MSKPAIFTGAGVALVTPMHPDGSINFEKYRELIDFQIENGTDAIIAVGTTGEASTLDNDEHLEAIRVAVEHTKGRVPVIAGTGSNNTRQAIYMSTRSKELGADGLLLVTPYYNKTSQRGLIAHYTAIAKAVDLPMILYNVPTRTGLNLKPETVAELYKLPQINAVKQASSNFSETTILASLCDIPIYSGNDDLIVPTLALGGKGVISVLSNVAPRAVHDLCASWFAGNTEESLKLQLQYLDLANALFTDVNPIPVKEALNMMGFEVGQCRLPLYDMEPAAKEKLRAVLQRYDLIK
ncbi:MAG: 4-hydroxy-tetrahydrodipicolinate synthase [Clostridia bacterium]|nr:4-hydroxy-tetrahydrodipicolinate synthase [Clostridia bacterium]